MVKLLKQKARYLFLENTGQRRLQRHKMNANLVNDIQTKYRFRTERRQYLSKPKDDRTLASGWDDRLEAGYRGAKGLKDAVKMVQLTVQLGGRYHQGKRRNASRVC